MLLQLRTLLSDVDLGFCEPGPVFDKVLESLEDQQLEETSYWSGNIDDIQDNAEAVVALYRLLFDRWLPLIE